MIPCANLPAVDNLVFFNNSNAEPRQIIVACRIHPRHFRGFASNQRGPGHLASGRNSGDNRLRLGRRKLGSSEIIKEVERLGSHHKNIVDTHSDEVDADGVVAVQLDCQFEFGSDAVRT